MDDCDTVDQTGITAAIAPLMRVIRYWFNLNDEWNIKTLQLFFISQNVFLVFFFSYFLLFSLVFSLRTSIQIFVLYSCNVTVIISIISASAWKGQNIPTSFERQVMLSGVEQVNPSAHSDARKLGWGRNRVLYARGGRIQAWGSLDW